MSHSPSIRIAAACCSVAVLTSAVAHAERSSLAPEVGYHYGESEDARWAACGGALRAVGNGTTAVWGNPAGMVSSQVYHVGALAQIWPEARRQSYGAVAVDSITNRLGAGLGFVWNDQDPDGLERQSADLRLALAYPFSDAVSFGVTGRYLKLMQDGLGPLGDSYASGGLDDEAIVNGFSFDAGIRVAPSEMFSIGLLGSNLSNPGTGFQPTSFGGGLAVGTNDFFIEGDLLADFTTWRTTTLRGMGGAEYLAADHYPLRLGYRYDDGDGSHAISGGVGYIDPNFSVDFGVRRTITEYDATTIVFTLQYFVESSGLTGYNY